MVGDLTDLCGLACLVVLAIVVAGVIEWLVAYWLSDKKNPWGSDP